MNEKTMTLMEIGMSCPWCGKEMMYDRTEKMKSRDGLLTYYHFIHKDVENCMVEDVRIQTYQYSILRED